MNLRAVLMVIRKLTLMASQAHWKQEIKNKKQQKNLNIFCLEQEVALDQYKMLIKIFLIKGMWSKQIFWSDFVLISRCCFWWFCEIESHEAFGFCETVGHAGNEEAKDNEGNENSVHDSPDTIQSVDSSGALETRNNKKQQKRNLNIFWSRRLLWSSKHFLISFGFGQKSFDQKQSSDVTCSIFENWMLVTLKSLVFRVTILLLSLISRCWFCWLC